MALFPANPTRLDPLKNFKFRIKWNGNYVAGVSKISALKRTTEVVEFRDGADPSTSRKSAGRTKYDPITIERGVTLDTTLADAAYKVWNYASGPGTESSLADFRAEVSIEMYNEAGQLVIRYNVHRCWISEYQALPDLDANANAVAIEHVKIENEGWEPDTSVPQLTEPSFNPLS